ncbi:MAG: hypothetical protein M1827_007710 [Pycnora praestabilis]|nr:MAG: hypothetical protein M1827_007710 [Pycnora praestabilis]
MRILRYYPWQKRDVSTPPRLLKYRSSKSFILATVCIAVFTDIFLYGIIVPVIPFALTDRVGVPQNQVQHWVSILLAVYGAALLAASPICGWLADRSASRRLPLLVGLLALGGATVMLCVGSSIGVLVAGRFLQGLSAAVVWTVGLALLVDTVGQKSIGEAMGYVSLSMSLGIMVAPLLGGVVYAKGGYYSVFAMAFGLIVVDIFLRLMMVEKKIAARWSITNEGTSYGSCSNAEPSPPNQKRVTTNVGSPPTSDPSSAIPTGSQRPPSEEEPNTVLSRFVHHLPPIFTLLRSRRLLAALWGSLVQASLMTSFDSVLPLFVQRIFGWSSTGAGLIFLPLIIPNFSAPLVGMLADKYGPRWLAATGFLLGLPFLVLLRVVTHHTIEQIVLLCALLVLIGFSLTLVMPPLMAEITYVVEAKEKKNPGLFGTSGAYAQAYGLFNCAFAGGTLVGPIWAGFVEAKAGWGTMSWSLGLLSALSAIPAIIWTGGLITKRHREGIDKRWVAAGPENGGSGDEQLNEKEERDRREEWNEGDERLRKQAEMVGMRKGAEDEDASQLAEGIVAGPS